MRKLFLSTVAAAAVLSSGAFAADLPVRGPAVAPAPIFVAMNWKGFYVGVNVGYLWGDSKQRWVIDPANQADVAGAIAARQALSTRTLKPDGFTGGAQIGYNVQINSLVLGLEGDLNFVDGRDSRFNPTLAPLFGAPGDGNNLRQSTSIEWMGTIRGRVGVAFDRVLLFATGGVAFGGLKFLDQSAYAAAVTQRANVSKTAVGWTVGAGIEYAVTNNLSVKAEYLYADLGSHRSYSGVQPAFAVAYFHHHKVTTNTVKVGLNYRFGGPSGPVVAKY